MDNISDFQARDIIGQLQKEAEVEGEILRKLADCQQRQGQLFKMLATAIRQGDSTGRLADDYAILYCDEDQNAGLDWENISRHLDKIVWQIKQSVGDPVCYITTERNYGNADPAAGRFSHSAQFGIIAEPGILIDPNLNHLDLSVKVGDYGYLSQRGGKYQVEAAACEKIVLPPIDRFIDSGLAALLRPNTRHELLIGRMDILAWLVNCRDCGFKAEIKNWLEPSQIVA